MNGVPEVSVRDCTYMVYQKCLSEIAMYLKCLWEIAHVWCTFIHFPLFVYVDFIYFTICYFTLHRAIFFLTGLFHYSTVEHIWLLLPKPSTYKTRSGCHGWVWWCPAREHKQRWQDQKPSSFWCSLDVLVLPVGWTVCGLTTSGQEKCRPDPILHHLSTRQPVAASDVA